VVEKRELSNTTKLSVFTSIFLHTITYGPESCVLSEIVIYSTSGRDGVFAKSSLPDNSLSAQL